MPVPNNAGMRTSGYRRWRRTRLDLTDRQEEVLRLIERGMTNGQIATELGITLDGVKFHVSEILSKLEVGSREEAVAVWSESQSTRPGLAAFAMKALAGIGAAVGTIGIVALALFAFRDDGVAPVEQPTPGVPSTPTLLVRESPAAPSTNCPPPRTPTPTPPPGATEVPVPPEDGPGAIRFFGRWYWPVSDAASLPLPSPLVGPEFAEVCFVRPRMVPTPPGGDEPRDGDSSIESHEVGRRIFEVIGYEPTFRLAAQITGVWFLFEAREPGNGRTGADVLDLEGKVERIELLGPLIGDVRAMIDDPATVQTLVADLLASPMTQPLAPQPGEEPIWMRFVFLDGTATVRPLLLGDPPRFDRFILVPEEFVGPVVAAFEGSE